jgi:FKBP-type peptidyl-prolyl cis-trans isomerase
MKNTTLILSAMITSTVLFLAACQSGNSKFPGYNTTKSGLIYKIVEKGSDTAQPHIGNFLDVVMTYGTEDTILFDSRTLPQEMQIPMIASVHQGDIYEGFSLMHTGDSAVFVINADSVWTKLFHMPKAPPEFDSVEYLRFNIRLNEVVTAEEQQKRKEAERKEFMDKELKDRSAYLQKNYPDAKPTETGLYYIREKKGHGKSPEKGDTVKVHYTGTLLDGTKFDSSLDRGEPIEFPLGQGRVIRGWDEGIAMMKKGEKAKLIIPSELGYGPRGSGQKIPPYSTLVFEVELVDFTKANDQK